MLDNALEKARAACAAYLRDAPKTDDAVKTAIEPVLKAAATALAAANLAMASKKVALEIYSGHRDAPNGVDIRQTVRISLNADGKLIKEDKVSCKDGCHILGHQSYFVDVDGLVKNGLPMTAMVQNLNKFFDDPNFMPMMSNVRN
jgi:hypothetical protein